MFTDDQDWQERVARVLQITRERGRQVSNAGGPQEVIVGRIVHHHSGDGQCRAAIITGVSLTLGLVTLSVFFTGPYDATHSYIGGRQEDQGHWVNASQYDETAQLVGSWHWPQSCPRKVSDS